jgi:hypothetical protein
MEAVTPRDFFEKTLPEDSTLAKLPASTSLYRSAL